MSYENATRIAGHQIKPGSISDTHVNDDAAIAQAKIAGDAYELDDWTTNQDTLADSLQRIRAQIDAIIGKSHWNDSPSASLETVSSVGIEVREVSGGVDVSDVTVIQVTDGKLSIPTGGGSVMLDLSGVGAVDLLQQIALVEAEFDFALSKHIAG